MKRSSGCAIGALAVVVVVAATVVAFGHRPVAREVSFAFYGPGPTSATRLVGSLGGASGTVIYPPGLGIVIACPPGTELWLDVGHGATARSTLLLSGRGLASLPGFLPRWFIEH